MSGRNPWVVLGCAEDAPDDEVQRAFRRRVKQTHPDLGGDAHELATVVEAFDAVRQARPAASPPRAAHRPRPRASTPYDAWLAAPVPLRSWSDASRPHVAGDRGAARTGPVSSLRPAPRSFAAVLDEEIARTHAGRDCA